EQLCEILLEQQKGTPFNGRIVDVGTGTGIIALTLAASWPEAKVEAVDLSPDALSLAKENAQSLGLADRVQFHQGDLLEPVEGPFDLIAANLPYIAAEEIAKLSREVQFDPRSALDGGAIGTEIIFRLIEQATQKLRGTIALEIGHDQSGAICEELARHN